MKSVVIVGSGVVPIPPKSGGAIELIIYEAAKQTSKKINVFVLDMKNGRKEEEKIDGVNYIRLDAPRFRNKFLLRLTELVFGIKSVFKIMKLNKKSAIGAVHAHTVFTILPICLMKRFLPEPKLIYTCHNPAWSAPDEEVDILNRIVLRIEGFSMRRCDAITTVSEFMRKSICEKAGLDDSKMRTIYNFADSKFSPRHGNAWRLERKLDGPVVLFVGKLIPNKGVEHLIRAAEIVHRKMGDVKFVLAGPASFEHETENKWAKLSEELNLQDTVIFTGALSDRDLPKAYSSADIFCFPTLRESFGMVIAEAMASGLAVVTTDLPVTREVAGDAALYSRYKDAGDIAQKVMQLLDDRKMLSEYRKRSIKRSGAFGKKTIMKEYEKFYRKMAL